SPAPADRPSRCLVLADPDPDRPPPPDRARQARPPGQLPPAGAGRARARRDPRGPRHHRTRTGLVLTVVALRGNALIRPGERGTAAEQRTNLRTTCEALRPLLNDSDLVVTHGNGPQVGNELVRQERAA